MIEVLGDANGNILTCPVCNKNLSYRDSDVRNYCDSIKPLERVIECPICKRDIRVPNVLY